MQALAIDTNAYTAYCRDEASVTGRIDAAARIGVPIVVIGEIYYGAFHGQKRTENLGRLKQLLGSPRVEILHITEETARIFGEISTELALAGKPIQQNDIWIAALCKQYYFPLLTADKGFEHIIGLDVMTFDTAPR